MKHVLCGNHFICSHFLKELQYYPHSENENVSEKLFQQGICLPSGSNMDEDDQMRVIDCIKNSIRDKEVRIQIINDEWCHLNRGWIKK